MSNNPYESLVDDAVTDWHHRANCREVDPAIMQPEYATGPDLQAAFDVCAGCPVIGQCRQAAESHPAYGVWAGEWYGDPVKALSPCEVCGTPCTGRTCSSRCRVRAHRAKLTENCA